MMDFEVIFIHYWKKLIKNYPILVPLESDMHTILFHLLERIRHGGKIFLCGNGGSAADAEHIAGELMKSFKLPRPLPQAFCTALEDIGGATGRQLGASLEAGVPAIVLSGHLALTTAFMNDVDPHMVYAQQLQVLGTDKDIFLGISTSGNARNVGMAAIVAQAKGMYTIGLTGMNGGDLARYCNICLRVPKNETYEIQELHLPLYHTMCLMIEQNIWGSEELGN